MEPASYHIRLYGQPINFSLRSKPRTEFCIVYQLYIPAKRKKEVGIDIICVCVYLHIVPVVRQGKLFHTHTFQNILEVVECPVQLQILFLVYRFHGYLTIYLLTIYSAFLPFIVL